MTCRDSHWDFMQRSSSDVVYTVLIPFSQGNKNPMAHQEAKEPQYYTLHFFFFFTRAPILHMDGLPLLVTHMLIPMLSKSIPDRCWPLLSVCSVSTQLFMDAHGSKCRACMQWRQSCRARHCSDNTSRRACILRMPCARVLTPAACVGALGAMPIACAISPSTSASSAFSCCW
jgi:hypothetical protein